MFQCAREQSVVENLGSALTYTSGLEIYSFYALSGFGGLARMSQHRRYGRF